MSEPGQGTSWHTQEVFKTLATLATEGIKGAFSVNGLAATAALSFMAYTWGKKAPNFAAPIMWFGIGLFAATMAFLFSYLTNLRLYNESAGILPKSRHGVFLYSGTFFFLLSIGSFAIGVFLAVDMLAKGPMP
jgi:hypothetical protein